MKNKSSSPQRKEKTPARQVPKLRFPEFRDRPEWEERRVGDLVNEQFRQTKKPIQPYTGLGVRSHGKGTFQKALQDPEKNGMDLLYKVESNDLVVNITFAWEGAIAIAKECDHGTYVSHRFPTYTFIPSEVSTDFFRQIITTNDFVYKLFLISPGGAGRNRVMNKRDFLNINLHLPAIEEQQKVAYCFSSIDELIAAQTQKLDTLKAHKKGLVQQLFPVEGETIPKLRFPEFKDAPEWEKKQLGKIASFYKGKGISKADVDQQGKTQCIRYGELYTHYQEVIDTIVSKTNLPISELFFSSKNDVIIPASGETKLDIATASCVPFDGVAIGGDINIIRSNQNGIFISYYLNSAKKTKIAKIAQGDTIVHLYSSQLKGLDVMLPKHPEQQKIADCLSSLDELIAAQTQKLDTLKAYKKGLMQQLFPSVDEVNG